jgi:hypothetical protein
MTHNSKNTSRTPSSTSVKRTPFCKVCKDAGKTESEYTSHWPRESVRHDSAVVCPTLLSQECRYCHECGHTKKWCPVLAEKEEDRRQARLSKERQERDSWTGKFDSGEVVIAGAGGHRSAKIRFTNSSGGRPICTNAFGAVSDSSDDEETKNGPHAFVPSNVEYPALSSAIETASASMWRGFRNPPPQVLKRVNAVRRPKTSKPSKQILTEEEALELAITEVSSGTSSTESTPVSSGKLTKAQRKRRKQKDRKRKRQEANNEAIEQTAEIGPTSDAIDAMFGKAFSMSKRSWADECDSDMD